MSKITRTYKLKDGTVKTKEYEYNFRFYKFGSKTLVYKDGHANVSACKELRETCQLQLEAKLAFQIIADHIKNKKKLTGNKLREIMQEKYYIDIACDFEEENE